MSTELYKIKHQLIKNDLFEYYDIITVRDKMFELEHKYHSILSVSEMRLFLEIIKYLEVDENLSYCSSSKIHLIFK